MEATASSQPAGGMSLTEGAANHIKTLLQQQPDNASRLLRLYVEAGGCCGMQYGMVFDEKRDDDVTVEFFGVGVLIDPFSANYLHGAVIDYVETPEGGGFRISNPSEAQGCGCGGHSEA